MSSIPGRRRPTASSSYSQQFAKAQGKTVEQVRAEALAKSGLRRIGQPEDVAELALFLCSARARHIQGTAIAIDGGGTPGIIRIRRPHQFVPACAGMNGVRPLRLNFFTISIARRSSVIEASSVRKAACDVSVTFGNFAKG